MSKGVRALDSARHHSLTGTVSQGPDALTRVAFDRSVTGMLLVSGSGARQRVLDANQAAATVLGTTLERLRTEPWTEHLAEADRRLVARASSSLLSGAIPGWQHEVRVEGLGHTWVRIDLSPGARLRGRATILVQLVDRTGEREARAGLAQERRFVEAVLDTPTCLTVVTDLSGTVREFNAAAERLTGLLAEEVVGLPLWEMVIAPDRRAALRRRFEGGRFGTGGGTEMDDWITKDGQHRTLVWVHTFVGLGTTHPRVVMTGVDLTEKRVADGLAEGILGATTGSSIIATDDQGLIRFVNPGAERMLGYTSAELVGRSAALIHDQAELDRRATEAGEPPGLFALRSEDGPAGRSDWDYVRKDGTHLTVSLVVTTTHDRAGQVTGYLGVSEDVTESRRAERRLELALATEREAVRRLDALDRAKSDFVATVSHELRTPIASVLGYTELIRDGAGGEVSRCQDAMLQRVHDNGERLMSLIDNLLTLACAENETLVLDRTQVDLARLVARAVDRVDLVAARRVEMVLDLPSASVVVDGDLQRLEQVVVNLLTNAVKFSPDGGRVTVSLVQDGTTCQLAVSDTGFGIAQDDQARVFGKFFRSASAHGQAIQGAGLGLSIVEAVVEAHGGTVGVTSTPGRGACFTVVLPLAPPAG